jgi:hypothetical protein
LYRVSVDALPTMAPGMRSSLPIGVAILALLVGLAGVVLLLVGLLVLAIAGFVAVLGPAALFGHTLAGAIALIVLAVVLIVVAVGLWRRELWALALSIVVVAILLAEGVFRGTYISVPWFLLLLLLVYLVAVHRHFR